MIFFVDDPRNDGEEEIAEDIVGEFGDEDVEAGEWDVDGEDGEDREVFDSD
jgi:hypothetical protein